MSVVVAIKSGDKVYIGADSQVTKGGTRSTLHNPNNYKVWKVDGNEHALMAHVGAVRDANVVRLMSGLISDYDEYCGNINYRFVVKHVVPEIVNTLREANFMDGGGKIDFMNSSFLFAYKDKLYSISADCCVLEIDDYVAIGSGAPEAIGSLLCSEGEDPKQRIIKAIKASAASDIYVDYPIIITDTDKREFDVITENDEHKHINKPEKSDTKLDKSNKKTKDKGAVQK